MSEAFNENNMPFYSCLHYRNSVSVLCTNREITFFDNQVEDKISMNGLMISTINIRVALGGR